MKLQNTAILDQVRALADRIAASEGLDLVDAEWKGGSRGGTLRVFIDKEAGVTHGDCESVARQLSAALDVEDFIPAAYKLEVSSPGLDRKLSRESDFRRFQGRAAKVRVREPLHGARQLTGRIEGSSASGVSLRIAGGETCTIPFEDIQQARLVVEF